MTAFEPICRKLIAELLHAAIARGEVEWMGDVALRIAASVQCAFLNWPAQLHEPLIQWTQRNHRATLAEDRQAMSNVARELERYVDEMLDIRAPSGAAPHGDITAALMHEQVRGRPLSHEEITSILRNWTVGEVGTISASLGILAHCIAQHAQLQEQLRGRPADLPAAIDEILRIDGPLVPARRVTTRPVELNGRKLVAGDHISLNWIPANRDGRVFDNPDDFRLDRDPTQNLLYGAGIHVCPGAPLARMATRVFLEELLRQTTGIELIAEKLPTRATYPASGFARLPLQLRST